MAQVMVVAQSGEGRLCRLHRGENWAGHRGGYRPRHHCGDRVSGVAHPHRWCRSGCRAGRESGRVVLALLIFVFALISVPAIVFFPAYSIYFLAARYPALAALLSPPPPDSAAPASPQPEAPPLPPTPAPLG